MGEGKQTCETCGRNFDSDNSLWQHWRTKHKGQKGAKAPPRPEREPSMADELIDARMRRDFGEPLSEYDRALLTMFEGY